MVTDETIYATIVSSTLSPIQQRAVLGMYHYYKQALGGEVEEAYKRTLQDFSQVANAVYVQLLEKEITIHE